MQRLLVILSLLSLVACTIKEGDIAYELRLETPYVTPGGEAKLFLSSPEMDELVITSELELSMKRLDEEIELTLAVPSDVELGELDADVLISDSQRETVAEVSLTVITATLKLSEVAVELPVGEITSVEVDIETSQDLELKVDAPPLIDFVLDGSTLILKPLGLCEPCTVTLTLLAESVVVAQASIEVRTVAPPSLELGLPGLLTLMQGEQTEFELLINKVSLGSVALTFSGPAGISFIYPQNTDALALNLVAVVGEAAPTGVSRIEVTAQAGEVTAIKEFFVDITEVDGD